MFSLVLDAFGFQSVQRILRYPLARKGVTASRRRITRITHENNLVSSYTKAGYKPRSPKVNEAEVPNVLGGSTATRPAPT